MRVLIVDDNPDHRQLVIARLEKGFPGVEIQEIMRQPDLDRALEQGGFDIVSTDFRLNWTDGLAVLAQVKRMLPGTPVVMVTETGTEEIAAEGMKAGLSDYVLKGHLHRLPMAIQESLAKAQLMRERKEALERLKTSEERYRAVSELSSDYAYALRVEADGSLACEWVTQAFSRITGYSVDELGAGVLTMVAHPDDRPILERARTTLLEGRPYVSEVRILTRDNRVRWLRDHARPVRDEEQGRVVRIFGAGQDITESKRAEEGRAQLILEQAARAEAEAGERRYRSLAEAIPQIVWTARPDGHLDYYNRRWFEYTGLSEEQSLHSEGWKAVLHPEDVEKCRERWYHSVRTGSVYEIEYRFRRASDGSYRWHLGRAVALRDGAGEIIKWLGTSTDVDDQKRSQEAQREAQKLESIGLLAGGIAHDFNNLLTGILGNTSLAIEEFEDNSMGRVLLENVILASERAADLTRQLLAYSGRGRFFVQPVNFSHLVREIGSLIQTSIPKKVDLRLDLDSDLPPVEADSSQIQQLVMNLVINGAEAIGEERSGTVQVVTGHLHADESFFRKGHFSLNGLAPGRYVVLEVHDNGCGMDEDVKAHIFDPFFTTKFTGRGLGMAAALGIVRSHHGGIRVESAPGKGTTFQILFPALAEIEKPETAAPPPGRRELDGKGTVLVVDDEEILRRTARAALERYGYTVLLAEDGRNGADLFAREAAHIDLVLLDMTMPVMGGEEALVEIRRIRPHALVIGTSGYTEMFAMQRFDGGGLAGFIQKPYTAAELAAKVKEVLEAPRWLGAGEVPVPG